MFDRLMLLAKGKIIYFNKASLSVDYFKNIDFPCPELTNPADYFMTMMSIESIELDAQSQVGSVFVDKNQIEKLYEEQIQFFDDSYNNNAKFRNDHTAIAPGIEELDMGAPD